MGYLEVDLSGSKGRVHEVHFFLRGWLGVRPGDLMVSRGSRGDSMGDRFPATLVFHGRPRVSMGWSPGSNLVAGFVT